MNDKVTDYIIAIVNGYLNDAENTYEKKIYLTAAVDSMLTEFRRLNFNKEAEEKYQELVNNFITQDNKEINEHNQRST